jgi:hypothetical protein
MANGRRRDFGTSIASHIEEIRKLRWDDSELAL